MGGMTGGVSTAERKLFGDHSLLLQVLWSKHETGPTSQICSVSVNLPHTISL